MGGITEMIKGQQMTEEQLEKLGLLADRLDAAHTMLNTPLPPLMHVKALKDITKEISDEIKSIFIECGGDPQTWG